MKLGLLLNGRRQHFLASLEDADQIISPAGLADARQIPLDALLGLTEPLRRAGVSGDLDAIAKGLS